MTNLNFTSPCTPISFPRNHAEARRQTLQRLYERKATLEALIESLEAYARARDLAQITILRLRGN